MAKAQPIQTRSRQEPARQATVKPVKRLSDAEIRARIEEAAYYRAMQRGFAPGGEVEDWLQAEAQMKG